MSDGSAKRILIAPLDWGLGHTTRCIPIIRRLQSLGCEVVFAGNDRQQTFVRGIFRGISCRALPGYEVKYGRGALMPVLMRQVPGLIIKVRQEHKWLMALAQAERIDGIISDNRYGLWHPTIPSVILTHQLQIITGFGKLADGLLRRIHYRFLSRFSACWIVDIAGPGNLGGSLSHPVSLLPRSRYIGWLSQLAPPSAPPSRKHLLLLLSGPEPQRSILSDLLWAQAATLNEPVVFVEGAATAVRKDVPHHIRHYTRISGTQLRDIIAEASMVVCRSGYSTLMDLLLLRSKAILIPTPGQTEQEYLARMLRERGMFYACRQKSFSLSGSLEAARGFPFRLPETAGSHDQFEETLDGWVGSL